MDAGRCCCSSSMGRLSRRALASRRNAKADSRGAPGTCSSDSRSQVGRLFACSCAVRAYASARPLGTREGLHVVEQCSDCKCPPQKRLPAVQAQVQRAVADGAQRVPLSRSSSHRRPPVMRRVANPPQTRGKRGRRPSPPLACIITIGVDRGGTGERLHRQLACNGQCRWAAGEASR